MTKGFSTTTFEISSSKNPAQNKQIASPQILMIKPIKKGLTGN